ncbi:MAG: CoA pyrophosphatase, partial [Pseudomonadota bacterium]|nr:CoA pyrophosphatase [Pseudomonadota bacterium]
MLSQLRDNLQTGSTIDEKRGQYPKHAAVLIALTDNELSPSVILTKRADHLNNHSGEVALPGGKWEDQDDSLLVTALRETHEEIGLAPNLVDVVGTLPPAHTWQGVEVTPYVGVVPEELDLTVNRNELDAIFNVPLQFFLDDVRSRTDIFPRTNGEVWSPAYDFDGYEIWGFTARLMLNFLNEYMGAGLSRVNAAREKDWAKEVAYVESRRKAMQNRR